MQRWTLMALLVVSVVCAGAGVALTGNPFAPPSFGWTAYSPLSDASYPPIDPTALAWAPKIGAALLAIGAGSTGAVISALVLRRRTGARNAEEGRSEG